MSQTKAELIEPQGNVAFDTNTLYVDASNNRVGIGTTSPSGNLHSNAAYTNTSDLQVIADGNIAGFNARSSAGGRFSLATGYIGANITSLLTSTSTSNPSSEVMRFTHSTGEIDFFVGGSGAAKIDASRRLLVGTSSAGSSLTKTIELANAGTGTSQPAYQVYSYPGTDQANTGYFQFFRSRGSSVGTNTIVSSGDRLGMIRWNGANGTDYNSAAEIYAEVDGTPGASNDMPGRLVFSTTADGASSPTERMRIRQDGLVGINTTTKIDGNAVSLAVSGLFPNTPIEVQQNTTGTHFAITFRNGFGLVGNITTSGSSTAFNTSSDYRLKENVTPVNDGITRLQQLKPSRFNFIVDPAKTVDGFIAHEVQAVVPEAITGEKDAVDADGNPVYQGIDQSKLVPLLTAALQEAVAKIESLEARLTAAGL